MLDAVPWKLARVGLAEDEVALNASVDDLGGDVLVGDADDQAVFWCVAGDRGGQI